MRHHRHFAPVAEDEVRRGAPAAGDLALPNLDLPPHDPEMFESEIEEAARSINDLGDLIHSANIAAGWWTDLQTGDPKPRNVFELLALVHSEVSEAVEHHRKGTMDDKLPERPGIEVEIADAIIRCLDIGASLRLDIGGAIVDKLMFNQQRADHKIENRLKPGGKAA